MDRRVFLGALGLLAVPVSAGAQPANRGARSATLESIVLRTFRTCSRPCVWDCANTDGSRNDGRGVSAPAFRSSASTSGLGEGFVNDRWLVRRMDLL